MRNTGSRGPDWCRPTSSTRVMKRFVNKQDMPKSINALLAAMPFPESTTAPILSLSPSLQMSIIFCHVSRRMSPLSSEMTLPQQAHDDTQNHPPSKNKTEDILIMLASTNLRRAGEAVRGPANLRNDPKSGGLRSLGSWNLLGLLIYTMCVEETRFDCASCVSGC